MFNVHRNPIPKIMKCPKMWFKEVFPGVRQWAKKKFSFFQIPLFSLLLLHFPPAPLLQEISRKNGRTLKKCGYSFARCFCSGIVWYLINWDINIICFKCFITNKNCGWLHGLKNWMKMFHLRLNNVIKKNSRH